jgi:uncharacterized protein (TIGR02147 family)
MSIFDETDYKAILRARIRELGKSRKGFNLRRIAEKVGIQYTYLSRLLNDGKYHLNEDHLFLLGEHLEFFAEEMKYLSLLRAHASSTVKARRDLLGREIERLRSTNELEAPVQIPSSSRINKELAYLLDPMCIIVHSSLEIPAFLKSPRLLCSKLDISPEKLRVILRSLDQIGFIELAADGLTVLKLKSPDTHYGVDHPVMRSHQNLLRLMSAAQVMKLAEESRQNFMVTFTADENAFEEVRKAFKDFIKRIERIVAPAKNEHTYQLNFDLFRWL